MRREINKLVKDIGEGDGRIYGKLLSIANKVSKRKKHLVIDIREMESMVDESKVEPVSDIDRVEVEV